MTPTKTRQKTREPLTRERVLEAALGIMDREGPGAVTMRRLGRELGVEAMSLYNHVRDKDDLITGMIERVMSGFEVPDADTWEDRARALVRSWRRVMKAHPGVIQLFAEHRQPMSDPEGLSPIELSLQALSELGLSDEDTATAYQMFGGYIMGFVMQEARGMFAPQEDGEMPDPVKLIASLPPGRFPTIERICPILCDTDLDSAFEFGVDVMIAGLRERIKR